MIVVTDQKIKNASNRQYISQFFKQNDQIYRLLIEDKIIDQFLLSKIYQIQNYKMTKRNILCSFKHNYAQTI